MVNRSEMPLKVVRVRHELTIANALAVRDKLTMLLTRADLPDVVFDLSDVTEVDASGIGAFTAAYTVGLTFGHHMFLYNPSPAVRELLEKLDLTGFFPLIKSESELMSRVQDITRTPE